MLANQRSRLQHRATFTLPSFPIASNASFSPSLTTAGRRQEAGQAKGTAGLRGGRTASRDRHAGQGADASSVCRARLLPSILDSDYGPRLTLPSWATAAMRAFLASMRHPATTCAAHGNRLTLHLPAAADTTHYPVHRIPAACGAPPVTLARALDCRHAAPRAGGRQWDAGGHRW